LWSRLRTYFQWPQPNIRTERKHTLAQYSLFLI
jgi:hypothetical protein